MPLDPSVLAGATGEPDPPPPFSIPPPIFDDPNGLRQTKFTLSYLMAPDTVWYLQIEDEFDNGVIAIPIAGQGMLTALPPLSPVIPVPDSPPYPAPPPPPVPPTGNGAIPFASRQACKIIQLYSPICKRTVTWQAAREGAKPVCPHPTPVDPNLILKKVYNLRQSPALQAQGQRGVYRIGGVYEYLMRQPVWVPGDSPTMGATAYDITPAAQNLLKPTDFVQGLF